MVILWFIHDTRVPPFDNTDKEIEEVGQILWKNYSFRVFWGHKNCNSEPLESVINVIGNIFENKELLK